MPSELLLLDACVTLNLLAADCVEHLADTCDITFVMAERAAAEVLYLDQEVDGERRVVTVGIEPLVAAGVLRVESLTDDEADLFVELAQLIDDGEAATMAIAVARGLPLATDGRKATKLASRRGVQVVATTPSLLHDYVIRAELVPEQARTLLHRVESRARYLPPSREPSGLWWNEVMGRARRRIRSSMPSRSGNTRPGSATVRRAAGLPSSSRCPHR